jgi:hypothetical protein
VTQGQAGSSQREVTGERPFFCSMTYHEYLRDRVFMARISLTSKLYSVKKSAALKKIFQEVNG